jgi:hypothetical protein
MGKKIKTPEEWVINQLSYDNKLFLLRFNQGLWKIYEDGNLSFHVGIATPLNRKTNNGFPTPEENKELAVLEDYIYSLFNNNNAVFAGTITGSGMKELVLYSNNPDNVKDLFKKIEDENKEYKLQLIISEDKEWKVFRTYCPQK